ncbi:MAG: hypothetical protein L0215_13590 [Gemmataceae bacterium]|nr:hypothetical protein [Gemmataceae bacterium]
MRVCLYEDRADLLEPLCLTRPVFELRCGLTSLASKQLRRLDAAECGYLVRPLLEETTRQRYPDAPVNEMDWLRAGPLVLINGRWLPPASYAGTMQTLPTERIPKGPCVGLFENEIAFAVLGQDDLRGFVPSALPDFLEHWKDTVPAQDAEGAWIRFAWDLVARNGAEITRDYAEILGHGSAPSSTLALVGPANDLWVHPQARIEPYVVADTTAGPVVVDDSATITAFSRLEGPCYVGPRTHVHGAKIRAGTTLGPECRIGGEVEASIVHGYSNKYHDGFLGHAYVGEWVNLGAGTHNSDLRNDYGDVSVILNGQKFDTGLNKVGCFLGDHVKTGLGTLFNTGTSVGVFCNLLPAGRFAPKYVPSFCNWWNGALQEGFDLEQLLATARQVMKRRGQELTPAHVRLYTRLHGDTGLERHRALRDKLRRTA